MREAIDRAPARGEATREALIGAAMEVFGRDGFHAASTRAIAQAAQVNQSLIGYHFGGKRGIYLAVFEHIAHRVQTLMGPVIQNVEQELERASERRVPRAELEELLGQAVSGFVAMITRDESAAWARLILREQQDPSEAFDVLYRGMMGRALGLITRLIAHIRGDDPGSEPARLAALTIMGQVLVFRVARAAVLRHVGWKSIGPDEVASIQATVRANVAAMLGSRPRR